MVAENNIKSSEVSVVVQGPIHAIRTKKTLRSIRKHLPDAEIILSTWENSNLDDLDFDILILNKDPGNVRQKGFKKKALFNNINRMILSTNEGLKKVSRKYTLKLRTDSCIDNLGFIEKFDFFPARCDKYKLFEKRVIASTVFTRYAIEKHKERREMPFHVSDWWFFGLTSDVKKLLLAAELVDEPYFSNYFEYPENQNKDSIYEKFSWKFAPEQYIGYSCFSKYFDDVRMIDCSEFSEFINKKSQMALANNFIFLEYKQSGIYNLKYLSSKKEMMLGNQYLDLYTFYNFELEYKKYCDSNYIPTGDSSFSGDRKTSYKLLRFYKHLQKLVDSESSLSTRLEQIFFGIPISAIGLIPILITMKLKKGRKNEIK